ncbi:MAG: zinc ribbon domain-containing protein [Promethearchaeota archaeon]
MSAIELYIPEEKLSEEIKRLIPGEDTILYTTTVYVKIIGSKYEGTTIKVGELAITNRGIAFFAKAKGLTGGLISKLGGSVHQYIRYDRIKHITGKGARLQILVEPLLDSEEKETEYELIVEQSKPYEKKSTFNKRKGQFSAFLELAIYRYRTGQAVPTPTETLQHPATQTRATLEASQQPRRFTYCPSCGAFLEEPAYYCSNCGELLDQ